MKRRFRPIFLAALCWLLVALVPATRNSLLRAGSVAFSPVSSEQDDLTGSDFARQAKTISSQSRRAKIDFIARASDKIPLKSVEKVADELGESPLVVTLLLRAQLRRLKSNRNEGPLTNPGGPGAPLPPASAPESPRADFDRFIALARRGQKLEPNNTFFDWMLLYGLYATRRDEEARAALQIAARKTDFNDHSGAAILNRYALLREIYGPPLSPSDTYRSWDGSYFAEYGKMRQIARWVMEGNIADRAAGQHDRALNASFDLAKLGRVMRRESHSLIGSLVASAIQGIALSRITAPPPLAAGPRPRGPRLGAPLATYQASSISLYAYAKSRNRADITRFLDREWVEIGQWRALNGVIINQEWTGNSHAATTALTGVQRLNALILRALPSILILGAVFTLLSRRFRDDSGAQLSGFWRGAWASGVLFCLALIFDAIIVLRQNDGANFWPDSYLEDGGLLTTAPSWITIGIAFTTILCAFHRAIQWQKQQTGQNVAFKTRLKTLFDAPEDGLMRFDFGWVFGLVARLTLWILLLIMLVALCFGLEMTPGITTFGIADLGPQIMTVALLISLVLHVGPWRTLPRRRLTLRLGLRLISQSLLGFFVASSLLYALVAFVSLPFAFRFERNFQNAMERGEVQIARAKLGL